jgi:hypothetical protein
MKTNFFAVLLGTAVLTAGCISTVTEEKTWTALPLARDRMEGRYERPVDEVFQAAKDVVSAKGVLLKEGVLHDSANLVKTVQGKVNQCSVWVRVEQIDPKVTSVIVQARGSGGGTDIDLAAQIDKEIALKLVQ